MLSLIKAAKSGFKTVIINIIRGPHANQAGSNVIPSQYLSEGASPRCYTGAPDLVMEACLNQSLPTDTKTTHAPNIPRHKYSIIQHIHNSEYLAP